MIMTNIYLQAVRPTEPARPPQTPPMKQDQAEDQDQQQADGQGHDEDDEDEDGEDWSGAVGVDDAIGASRVEGMEPLAVDED